MDLSALIVCLIMLVVPVKDTEVGKTPILKYTQVERSFILLCMAEGNQVSRLIMANHPKRHNYDVTINGIFPPTDGHVTFTSKLEYKYPCGTSAFNLTIRCCTTDPRNNCVSDYKLICEDHMDSFSTHAAHIDDVSSDNINYDFNTIEPIFTTTETTSTDKTTTDNTSTTYEVVHTNNTDREKPKNWLLLLIIGGGGVAVIVAVTITVVVLLSKRKASMQRALHVHAGLSVLKGPDEMERFKRQSDIRPDTSICDEIMETIASHVEAYGSAPYELGLHDLGSDSAPIDITSDNATNEDSSDSDTKELYTDSALNESKSESAPNESKSDSAPNKNIAESAPNDHFSDSVSYENVMKEP